jgi:PelA/Pel-15E family pectate lyase
MVNILLLLRDVSRLQEFRFVRNDQREAAAKAFDRGIQCILRCQIIVGGNKTVWCAQHDEKDFQPRPGRSYELVSLSGGESVGIVRLLMSIERPTPEVIASVQGAVAWFEAAKLPGIKEVKKEDPNTVKGYDKVVIADAAAPPMWARFYQISTNKPIFSDRDGVAKANLADIGYERRNGYAWLGYWPRDLLAKDYPAWKQKWMNPSPSD